MPLFRPWYEKALAWSRHPKAPWLLTGLSFIEAIKQQAADNGFWLLPVAGFTPIPFKVFTIASGAVGMPLLPFFFGALIGRGKRVFLVAAAIRLGGERAERALHRHIEPVGWVALAVLAGLVAWLVMKAQGT